MRGSVEVSTATAQDKSDSRQRQESKKVEGSSLATATAQDKRKCLRHSTKGTNPKE